MKILLLSSTVFAWSAMLAPPAHAVAVAVDPVMDLGLGERAHVMTQPLINRLFLNEGEYVRLRSVHRVLLATIDNINAEFAQSPEVRRAKLVELQGYYEQERTRVLNRTQLSRLEERPVRDAMPTINPESGGLG